MRASTNRRHVGLFLALALLAAVPVEAATTSVSCLSSKCHREISRKRYIHGPIGSGSCEVCHQVSSTPPGKHPSLLTRADGETCFHCHEEKVSLARQKHRHTPVDKGECTACHDPHQADNRFLLSGLGDGESRTASLCLTCHDKADERWKTGFHGSVSLLDCTVCHDPHASPDRLQLTRYVRTVYLRDHLALGEEDMQAGRYADALANFRLVLTVEPREVIALTLSAKAHLALNDPASARPHISRLLEINPLDAEAFHLNGLAAMAAGEDYRAMSLLQQSVSLRPDVPGTLISLGTLQLRNGMSVEALATLTRATQVRPNEAAAHQALEQAYRALGKTAEADREKELVEKLLQAGP